MTTKVRLLICRDCRTVEELPDFTGPPEHDVLLDHAVEKHVYPNGERHFGNLADIDEAVWRDSSKREEVLRQIRSKTTGLDSEFYAAKNTFEQDALKCYAQHRRPDQGCIDWQIEKKRLGNPSKLGWQVGPKVYLCDFCPVRSWVDTQKRHEAGAYKEN